MIIYTITKMEAGYCIKQENTKDLGHGQFILSSGHTVKFWKTIKGAKNYIKKNMTGKYIINYLAI